MTTSQELTVLQRIALTLLWNMARCVAVLPHWFKYYVLEECFAFLFCCVLRYRRKVVDTNLANSFPDKSPAERAAIRRRFYRTLAEIIVDTLNLSHPSLRKIRRLFRIEPDEVRRISREQGDWVAMMAHYGCWEYGSFFSLYLSPHCLVSVHHAVTDPVIDAFYHRLRNNARAVSVSMQEFMRFYLRHRKEGFNGKPMILGLISDQNPPLRPDSHWFRFLNQDTIFFSGAEKLALRCGLPIYFARMDRFRRGCYRMSFEPIYDGREAVEPNEITERYVRKLEAQIRERPELWMWSHRRWKVKRPDGC